MWAIMKELIFGEGNSRAEQAIRAIRENLNILEDEGQREINLSEARQASSVSSQHKAIGENLRLAAQSIKTRLDNLARTVEEAASSHLTGQP